MSRQQLTYTQKIGADIDTVWDFFSNPLNLERITPPDMHFTVTGGLEEQGMLYEGMEISYTLYPLWNVPVGWVTAITRVSKPVMFEDEQKEGPYEYWHHKHLFREVPGGVEMTDIIDYKLPYGALGDILDFLIINQRLDQVFAYRREKIKEIFQFKQTG